MGEKVDRKSQMTGGGQNTLERIAHWLDATGRHEWADRIRTLSQPRGPIPDAVVKAAYAEFYRPRPPDQDPMRAALSAALRPLAPAESEVMQHQTGTLHRQSSNKTSPLSASEPGGAKDIVDRLRKEHDENGCGPEWAAGRSIWADAANEIEQLRAMPAGPIPDAVVEAAARAICIADGAFDPDETTNGQTDWKKYEPHARAALSAANLHAIATAGRALMERDRAIQVGAALAEEAYKLAEIARATLALAKRGG